MKRRTFLETILLSIVGLFIKPRETKPIGKTKPIQIGTESVDVSNIAIWAGGDDPISAPFRLTNKGIIDVRSK